MTQAPGPAPSPAAAMQAFQERFAALQREWRALLPQRVQEAQDGLRACQAAPGDAQPLETLHRLLHTLAGSAGSFGLARVGEMARHAEHELDRLMQQPQRQAADFDEAGHRVQALAQAAAEA